MNDEFTDFSAPWEVYPEIPCGSIHWRMGSGESAMIEWWPKIRALTEEQRMTYRQLHPGPPEWIDWLDGVLHGLSEEPEKSKICAAISRKFGEAFLNVSILGSDQAKVRTIDMMAEGPKGGFDYKLKREEDGWRVLDAETRPWSL